MIGQVHCKSQIFKLGIEQGFVGKNRCRRAEKVNVPAVQIFLMLRIDIKFCLGANACENFGHPLVVEGTVSSVNSVQFIGNGQI